ncbi:bifunctional phosphoribosylaminoimidazolecarboxamide formyltransferase/IMP cyclohydrolase [Agrococcus sp. SCSIO52902]|uniref:bifunctional phosphoribosylaminoimidazolecarboxamide formyltransferase/IMP cyclohydrolase n=1 Tax=Agrococcus sp. SCSIO52902 TaxID=2933290 RepID=UPI001FF54D2B|nr:bifunctional phosphoribosylaminoimidazolecarboxamide formyltransferase/IMP cyclohydrolase [Agrococcus sp. SCSIO52902]UOV99735.1 bifunctional phosphoribosylaminoimidazolecarboxamide formyltransferase/IMP cyclohydrolase [Agrococcus sp. SCSIO52902]
MSGPQHDPSLYRERDAVPFRRALLSVSDKTGIVELGRALADAGVELVSTGSTARMLADAGLAVTEVAEVTGFQEALDGRVKTLHPAIHAGLLADLRLEHHEAQLAELGIAPFELVVVNLYPFVETVRSGAADADVVEQIDIGGPAMVRASAKNHANVAIVTDPRIYPLIAKAAATGLSLMQRRALARDAFAHTAAYDRAVARWFAGEPVDEAAAAQPAAAAAGDAAAAPVQEAAPAAASPAATRAPEPAEASAPDTSSATGLLQAVGRATLVAGLRYGENSHQQAGIFALPGGRGITQAELLHGKPMSFNNYVDADAALRAAFDFTEPAVAIIKHANPCGIAIAAPRADDPIASAHERAHACDPVSAFGGVIAANRPVTRAMAETVKDIFTEVVVAPDFEPEALELLTQKKNIRLLRLPEGYAREGSELRQVSGGVLVQQPDTFEGFSSHTWRRVSGPHVPDAVLTDLEFAWRAVRSVKSNAILLASGGASVGVGMGQVNRVDSCRLAVTRAGERAAGSVAASDAFFPFADGLQILLDAGVTAVVQPGGSVRDEEVIAAANAAGITMYFTGERHFAH